MARSARTRVADTYKKKNQKDGRRGSIRYISYQRKIGSEKKRKFEKKFCVLKKNVSLPRFLSMLLYYSEKAKKIYKMRNAQNSYK